ncbi:MAG: aminotransferase class I/II-fold pyridoxal phosphate-dependent enzyme [Oscillospiraceae bacterium]|nr:aminotransferase class I/II-fold pyridoxal phosphate-dependent enzyme [Oscillospiraceae bacterium]
MRPYEHGGDIYGGRPPRVDFSVSLNPLGMPPEAERALRRGTADDARYPDPCCRALRRALAEHCGVAAEQILCGAGASDLILRICAWRRPRRTVVPAPTFSEYGRCAALFGSQVEEFPLREEEGFALTEEFLSALTPDTELVFLCHPNNPTGRLCEPALAERIARRCDEIGACLVADECFIEFTEGESLLPLLPRYPRLLILRAFTKFYAMAGLRLGYLLCHDGAAADEIGAYGAEWSVSTAAQRAGLAALTAVEWRERTLTLVKEQRRALSAELARLGCKVYPSDANFLLCRGAEDVCALAARRGVLLRRCGTFTGLDGTYFRVGVRTAQENRLLTDTLREVLHG